MSAAAKKLPPAPRDSSGASSSSTATTSPSPSRGQPRSSTPASASSPAQSSATTTTTSPGRTRSVRSGAPVSARAAAAQTRRESPLSSITNVAGGSTSNSSGGGTGSGSGTGTGTGTGIGSGGAAVEREEALRAANIAALDDLRSRLERAETAAQQHQQQAQVLQARLDETLAEQARLEERVQEAEEGLEKTQGERREAVRQIREMENIYEAERSAMNKEREERDNREEEMQGIIQRLKDGLAMQRNGGAGEDELRPSRHSNNGSPSLEGGAGFAPPASLHRSDSRNNSKLLLQKDKVIESLRLELAEAQIKLVETENQGGGRLQEVEGLLMEARVTNARLMEDNESYQLLLQERTLNGDFSKTDFSYMSSSAGHGGAGGGAGAGGAVGSSSANQDALNALEGRSGSQSLADELSEAGEAESENYRRLEAELKAQKDQNKALTLYINKIIERLLQHQEFEHILDQSSSEPEPKPNTNKELPPPPAERVANMGSSLLARAKSIAIRPRPMSFMPSREAANAIATTTTGTANENPETAPSIPIGLTRSASTRRTRPMSEQFTGGSSSVSGGIGGGAAHVVNSMLMNTGPLSPPLRSNTGGFGVAGSSKRVPSGPAAAAQTTSLNFPGETSSVTSGDSTGEVSTPPSQSPPRPSPGREREARDRDRDRDQHEKSAVMFAGNKPRPLRLVQENPDSAASAAAAAAAAANKRASWIGWAFGGKGEGGSGSGGGAGAGAGASGSGGGSGVGESIRE